MSATAEPRLTPRTRPSLRPTRGEITLSGRVPWDITARWGISHVVADLGGIDLRGLEISGGSSHTNVRLPRPTGSVAVRIGGGASDVELIRPTGVPVRVHIGSGGSKLAVDDLTQEIAQSKPLEHKGNIEVVKKHVAEIEALIPEEAGESGPDEEEPPAP